MKKLSFIFFLFPWFVFSQEPLKIPEKILFKNQRYVGIDVHALGLGLVGRRLWNDNVSWQHFLEVDIVSMKHPKQIKTINTYWANAKGYDYGKLNSVFLLRTGYGKERILFDKSDFNGIMVSLVGSGGLSVAFLKPVYLEIIYEDVTGQSYVETERYNPENPNHTPYSIFGGTTYFNGIDEMKLQLGAYLKTGINFEFSKKDEAIRSVEAGVCIDAFKLGKNPILPIVIGNELPIMAIEKNKKVFPVFYINLNLIFGKKW